MTKMLCLYYDSIALVNSKNKEVKRMRKIRKVTIRKVVPLSPGESS